MSSKRIGKDPNRIDEEQPDDETYADGIGFDLITSDGQPDSASNAGNAEQFISMETESLDCSPENHEIGELADLIGVGRSQQQLIAQLGHRFADQQETIAELTDDVDELGKRVDDVKETADQSVATSKEIAATVNAVKADNGIDTDENGSDPDSEDADIAGPGEASLPMDFFFNCQQYPVN